MVLTIKRSSEINRVFNYGQKVSAGGVTIIIYKRQDSQIRFCYCIGKKQGTAVERNRIKRRLREIVRELLPAMNGGYDIVFLGRRQMNDFDFAILKEKIRTVCEKSGIIRP